MRSDMPWIGLPFDGPLRHSQAAYGQPAQALDRCRPRRRLKVAVTCKLGHMTDESQDCLLDAVGIHQRRRGFRDDDARRLVSMPGGQLAGEAHARAQAASRLGLERCPRADYLEMSDSDDRSLHANRAG